jgi:hypothetical protein
MYLISILCIWNIVGFCYHWVNGISYGLAKSDLVKRSPLHKQIWQMLNLISLLAKSMYGKIVHFIDITRINNAS